MSTDFVLALELVRDVLLDPAFPAPELEREREVQTGRHPRAKRPTPSERVQGRPPRPLR